MKRARQERASSSGEYGGFGSLSSPRRVVFPLLVRDGKACPSGMMPTSPHQGSYSGSAADIFSGSSGNSRASLSYNEDSSLYSNSQNLSPFSAGPLGATGFGMSYSPEASPQFGVHSPQTRDYLSATYHHQIGAQQYGAAYSSPHLRGAAAAFNSSYALPTTNYASPYTQHQMQQKCWPTW